MMSGDGPAGSFFSEAVPFRDPLRLPYLAPLRRTASSRILPWPLRKRAAKLCMTWSRKRLHRVRHIAVDHSRWCSAGAPGDLGPIWQYWAQGVEAAPPVVKACLRS
ncbi:hypothetical protein EN813_050510, partial [Mesorhizobium sp. M00.F.Ca.ET.170.01.1.1]